MSRSERPFNRAGWKGSGRTWCLPASAVASGMVTLLLSHRGQVVELDDRVRLRPDAELPGVLERAVMVVDHFVAVEEYLDVVADHLHRELVPHARGDLAVPAGELHAAALHGVVEVDVVFERVGARDVVVVRVLETPDDPTALVDGAADRFALHRQTQVFQLGARVGDGKAVIRAVAVRWH